MSEPHCPKCSVPMRLMRELPSMLPPEMGVETRVFACGECWTTVSRTARQGVGTVLKGNHHRARLGGLEVT
jgi:hypothetical protein